MRGEILDARTERTECKLYNIELSEPHVQVSVCSEVENKRFASEMSTCYHHRAARIGITCHSSEMEDGGVNC